MISKYDQNYHGYYHKKGDEKSFTKYLCTKVDLLYCERLYHIPAFCISAKPKRATIMMQLTVFVA